jgi:hypothetical protein
VVPSRGLSLARAVILIGALALASLGTPWPWASLWLAVPLAVAGSLLLAWRFGRMALLLPVALTAIAALLVVIPGAGFRFWHVLWLPAAALTGVWMGLREEGGGPTLGERAWMHAPILAVAFAMPILPGMGGALVSAEVRARADEQQVLRSMSADSSAWRQMIEQSVKLPAEDRVRMLRYLTPNLVFGWMVLLVAAGRALAARGAAWRGWPGLSRAPVSAWRLPDGALVPLLAGIALALFAGETWRPGAVALLVQSVLGYSVQGLAVSQSILLERGVPPVFFLLLMLFLFLFTLPVFLPSLALIGLSDVWLDHRRLEPSPDRTA